MDNDISRARIRLGWAGVILATLIDCFWAFWGICENFHEGWYFPQLWRNLLLMFVQYLPFMLIFMVATVAAIRSHWVGAALFLGGAAFAAWFFRGANFMALYVTFVFPLVLLAVCLFWGRPEPKRRAYLVATLLPLLMLVVSGAEPVYRIATRRDDGYRGIRTVEGNGVRLVWAPRGPGWPDNGGSREDSLITWNEAMRRCRYLSEDGTHLESSPRDLWRLPTVDEVVRSQHRRGANAGGSWDPSKRVASYRVMPDKESPLWNPYTQVIYWWTADSADADRAFFAVFNGQIHTRPKTASFGYQGFRAVKSAAP